MASSADKSNDLVIPTDLASLATYQSGAIVSKVLVKAKGGSVTLFAFAVGQELSEHTAPFDALVQVVEGSAAVTVSGHKHTVNVGQVILLPENIPHAVVANEAFKMLLCMVRNPSGE